MAKRANKVLRSSKTQKTPQGKWFVPILLLTLGGVGYYGYDLYQQKVQESLAEEAARQSRQNARNQMADEMARLAAMKAEQDRLADEEEARRQAAAAAAAEEERRRKAEKELAERLKKLQSAPKTDKTATSTDTSLPSDPGTEACMYDEELPMHGNGANSISTRKRFDQFIDNVLEKRDFDAFERAMMAKITAAAQAYTGNGKLNYAQYKANRNMIQAVDLCLLIRLAGSKAVVELAATDGDDNDNNGADFLRWALRNKNRPLHLFLQNFLTQGGLVENAAHALRQFYTIWAETEADDREKYLNLTIAGALINPSIAESKGQCRTVGTIPLTVPQVCAYMREMDSKHKLATDITKLSVSQLLHVVDVRLPQNEFDWAEDNATYSQNNWAAAINDVEFLLERAAHDTEPYEEYTLEEIKKEGGICKDQAYYASATGKCRGVPVAIITGDGPLGMREWIISLTDSTKWTPGNAKGYTNGRYINPCSGSPQPDTTLLFHDIKLNDAKMAPAIDAMVLADYLCRIGCTKEAHSTAKFVSEAFPNETSAWAYYIKVLGHNEKNLPETAIWRKIDSDLIRLSKKNAELLELAAMVEDKYLFANMNAASKQTATQRSMSQLSKRGGTERLDLLLNAINRQAKVMAEARNLSALAKLYRKQFKTYGNRCEVFAPLLEQYMQHLGEAAPAKAWSTLAHDAEKIFEKHILSTTTDFLKLKKEVQIQKQIAGAWEKANNAPKAERLHRTADKRLEEAREEIEISKDKD